MTTDTNPLLSADEVDALMEAVASGGVDTVTAPDPDVEGAGSYDFTAPGRMISGIVPTLDMISDRFVAALRTHMHGMLQQHADLATDPVQMVTLSDYMRTLPVPCSVNMVRVKPLRGTALVVFEPHLVTCATDSFFGGGRRAVPVVERSGFTAIELRIIRKLLDAVCWDLSHAWHSVMALEFSYLGSESNPAYANVDGASDAETMIVNVVNVALEGGAGAIHVLMPYSMLEPLRTRLTAVIQNAGDDVPEAAFSDALMGGIASVGVTVSSTLVEAQITLEELLRLAPGDVLSVQIPPGVTLDVDGIPVYRGLYGTVGETHAVQVTGPAPRA